ncbi:hypothetical protein ACFQU2_14600 [Siccirubricoccus deserti]
MAILMAPPLQAQETAFELPAIVVQSRRFEEARNRIAPRLGPAFMSWIVPPSPRCHRARRRG